MAATPDITDLDIAAWLRKARKQADPAVWLGDLNEAATDAIASGDEYVTVLSNEGSSSTQQRDCSARFVQHVTEACIQRLEAETAAGGAHKLPSSRAVRVGDFS